MTEATGRRGDGETGGRGNGALLEVRDLRVEYRVGGEFAGGRLRRAVDGVTLSIDRGRTLGLVGESGSGKSTVAKAIAGLAPVSGGEVLLGNRNIAQLSRAERRDLAARIQMLFQDPYGSLNPRQTAGEAIWEAPVAAELAPWIESRRDRATELLGRVGLGADALGRYPHEFSGGQRQRIALARALALGPEILLLDEPTSALDVSVAAQILNLLTDLQSERHLTYLLIGHDLAAVEKMADGMAVMYAGQIVETAPAARLLGSPVHPYTRMLIATAGGERQDARRATPGAEDETPAGCRYAPRCKQAGEDCAGQPVELVEVSPGHLVRCVRAG